MTAIHYGRFLNPISACRRPSVLREMTHLLIKAGPSVVFLATGLPNPTLFPFEYARIYLKDEHTLTINAQTMEKTLQYGPTPGFIDLIDRLRIFQKKYHNPPRFDNYDIIITTGSQDGLSRCIEMLMSPRDYVLIPVPAYSGVLRIFHPYKPKFLPIETDDEGAKPDSLKEVLKKWDPSFIMKDSCVVPKFLYISPTGSNPTGSTLTLERKKQIYKIAQDYDLLILEDDPYYFTQFSGDLIPSFLSLDVEGRVIRFDSFSKIISSGIRVGFVTGPRPLMERINLHMQISVLHTSNLSQVLVNELLKHWGESGFERHILNVQFFYRDQKNMMLKYARRWLKGQAEWNDPIAGMFLWMKILKVEDTYPMIMEKGIDKEVILVPGVHFQLDNKKPSSYLRASFSTATKHEIVDPLRDEGLFNMFPCRRIGPYQIVKVEPCFSLCFGVLGPIDEWPIYVGCESFGLPKYINTGFQRLSEMIREERKRKTSIGDRERINITSIQTV